MELMSVHWTKGSCLMGTTCLRYSSKNYVVVKRIKMFQHRTIIVKNAYRRCLEKGSDDIESVCCTIYSVYLSLCTQTAETIVSEPFSRHPLYNNCTQ